MCEIMALIQLKSWWNKHGCLKVCARFVLKNYLTAVYPYIRDENSTTGCTSFIKCFAIAVFYFIFESVGSIVNKIKSNNIFTGLNVFFKAFNFRFWKVFQSFDYFTAGMWYFVTKHKIISYIKNTSVNHMHGGKVIHKRHRPLTQHVIKYFTVSIYTCNCSYGSLALSYLGSYIYIYRMP